MKYKDLKNSQDESFNIFADGFYANQYEPAFITDISTVLDISSASIYTYFDSLLHAFIDDEYISPLVKSKINDDNVISTVNGKLLATIIQMHYFVKWERLWRDYYNPDVDNWINTYNPIENYDRYEVNSGSDDVVALENDNKTTNKKYGFNSATAVPSNETVNKSKLTTEFGHLLHIHGNIGVTTTSQLLSEERNLWMWSFIEVMIKDLQNMLTLSVYDCEVII